MDSVHITQQSHITD